jgi:hypothetical protein
MKSRKSRILACTLLFMIAGLLVEQWPPEGHYAAPILAVAIATVLYGLRIIWAWRPKQTPFGPMLVRSIVVLLFLWSLVPLGNIILDPYGLADDMWLQGPVHSIWMPTNLERARLEAQLERAPGRQMIFVHFPAHEIPGLFWIYNDPDIAHSKIIWTYDMGTAANEDLIRLYPNRHLWYVDKTNGIMPLLPYSPSGQSTDSILAQARQEETHAR